MDKHGLDRAVPRIDEGVAEGPPLLSLTSGYIERARSQLPKQGPNAPWLYRQNYVLDALAMRVGGVTTQMVYSRRRGASR
jgi:hypothetical protein